jgi:hypothetical protein
VARAGRVGRFGRVGLPRVNPTDPLLLTITVLAGVALVVASTSLGSGDYGQWLMAARPFNGLDIPDYREAAAVPPVVPYVLALLVGAVGDALIAVRLFAVLVLCALGVSAYVAGATLFRSRQAGLLATVLSLVVVDQFLDLLAFGGLLQATSIVFAWLTVAAYFRAAHAPASPRAWLWWTVGACCVGLAAITHMGTGYILVPTGCAIAVIAARHAASTTRARLARLVPLVVVLTGVGVFWIAVLLPGGTDLIRNPASLDYRGPDRLLDNLTGYLPTAAVALLGVSAVILASVVEMSRRRHGPWIVLGTWAVITVTVLMAAVLTRAATDYPRFATPILAPLVVGAAGALSIAVRVLSGWLAAGTRRGTARAWSAAVLVLVVVVGAPLAVDRFKSEARGYQLRDVASLSQAATWIDANLSPHATVLAPVREAKWIEGLTGRAALFSSAFRYSFRAEEWQRSLAADTLLRSNGALVNQYFFARLTADGADQAAARGLVIAANHGGEYLDLLTAVPGETRILSPDPTHPVLATLTNLAPAGREVTESPAELRVATNWTGERQAVPVTYRQEVTLHQGSSVLDLQMSVATTLPVAGLELELRPTGNMHTSQISLDGHMAIISFNRVGSGEPTLRVVLAGTEGALRRSADGGLRIHSSATQVRLLITDLTAASSPTVTQQWLDPAQLVDRYGVEAVLLARDPSLDARRARMAAINFHQARDYGPYVLMVRR